MFKTKTAGWAAGWIVALAGTASVQAEGVVNVYSSRHYDTDDAMYQDFTEKTGVEVNVISGEADELIERIKAEGANSPADLFITVDGGRLFRAEEAGILKPVRSEILDAAIPEVYRHPDGLWFGMTKRIRVIVHAKDRVQRGEISRYEDLASPAFEERVCIRSSANLYNQSLVAAMIESEGAEATEAWATGVVNNFARPPQGNDQDQIRAVAAGECDAALVNHYYLARMLGSDDEDDRTAAEAVEIVFPNQDDRGAHANISGIGMVATAPNKDNAVKLMEYMTTPDAQAQFALGNHEYPIVEAVPLGPVLEDWDQFKTDDVNASAYGQNNAEAVMIMDRVGWQ